MLQCFSAILVPFEAREAGCFRDLEVAALHSDNLLQVLVCLLQVQLTDFENAAFCVFIVLLTRTILSFGLNFLIPISKVQYSVYAPHVGYVP